MALAGIWKTLGIARTRDRSDIRRAYAKQLKLTNPEDNPEGFKALREAYERALAQIAMPEPYHFASPAFSPVTPGEVVTRTPEEPAVPDAPAPEIIQATPQPEPQSPPQPTPAATVQQAIGALDALLRRRTGDNAAALAAFTAIVTSPAMDDLGIHTAAENHLAHLILIHAPQSDVLLEPAITFFHWERAGQQVRTSPAVVQILRRSLAQPILKRLRTKGDKYHPAFVVLSQPPKPVTWLSRLMPPTPDDVLDLLRRIREKHPTLLRDLNAQSVDAWDNFHAKPRLPVWGAWSCLLAVVSLIAAPLAFFMLPPEYRQVAALCLPAPVAAIAALAQLYAYAWPRYLWHDELRRSPWWLRWGWAATGFTALELAACPPSWPLTILIILLAAITVAWAGVMGDPDRSEGQVPWRLRILLGNPLLVAWWLATVWQYPTGTRIQMTAALAAWAFAPGLARLTLYHTWLVAPKWLRMTVPSVLFVLSFPAAALLIYSLFMPDMKIWAFAAIAIIAVINKAPVPVAWNIQLRLNWRFGWIGLIALAHGAGIAIFMVTLLYLAGGLTLGWNMILMIRQFNAARKPERPR